MISHLIWLLLQLQSPAIAFEVHLSPGEGRPLLEVRDSSLALREQPRRGAPVAHRVPVRAPLRVSADSGRFLTLEAGWVRVVGGTEIKGRDYGARTALTREEYYGRTRPRSFPVAQGDSFEVLQYRAEGYCFVRVAGVVVETMPCPLSDDRFEVLRQPGTEWWVFVRLPRGPAGWIRVDDVTVVEVDRTF